MSRMSSNDEWVGNSYSEDQVMHTFLDNFEDGGKYSAQIASHQAELRREETFTDQKSLKFSSLQSDYLNIDSSSDHDRDSETAHAVQSECTFCGGVNHSAEKFFKRISKEKEKARAVDVSSNRQVEHTPRKCFICGSEDHMIRKFPKQVCLNENFNYYCNNGKMIVTARYMHLWHECISMTNGKIMVRLKTETEHLCKRSDRIQG